ncbi:MAG TPA: hypothetical protein V6D13_07930 [Halomicronema sp.]
MYALLYFGLLIAAYLMTRSLCEPLSCQAAAYPYYFWSFAALAACQLFNRPGFKLSIARSVSLA